jgi:hypothetical protein
MEHIEIIFFLLLSAVILVGIAQKINVPYPIILILGGAAIGFIPGIDNIYFNPNLVLMIFLPPILYYSAFGISFREFQRNWKNIFSLALGLVALTTLVMWKMHEIDDRLLTHLESELDMLETHTARAELKSGIKEMSKHERGEG